MAISKFLSHAFGEKDVEGRLVTLRSLLDLKKSTRTSDFQLNEPPPKSIRSSLPHEVLLDEKKIITKHWDHMAFTIGNVIALPLVDDGFCDTVFEILYTAMLDEKKNYLF